MSVSLVGVSAQQAVLQGKLVSLQQGHLTSTINDSAGYSVKFFTHGNHHSRVQAKGE